MKKKLGMVLGLILLGGSVFAGPSIPWMTGENTWALGCNYPWIQFGNDFSDKGYNPTRYRKDIDGMAASGVHVIRFWVFCAMHEAPLFSGPKEGSLCTGLPEGWVKNMVDATDYAYSKGIRIYYSLISFDIGHKYDEKGKPVPVIHADVVNNPKVQKSFLDNAVKPIVMALGKHPGVMAWDMMNEPEWIIKESAGDENLKKNECFPLSQMRSLLANMVKYVRPYVKQPISVGSTCIKWTGGPNDYYSGLGLDFFDIHFYDWMTPWFNPVTIKVSDLNFHTDQGKPVIVGEAMANPLKEYSGPGKPLSNYQMAVSLYNNGYAGLLSWAWNCDDNIEYKPEMIKNDFIKFYKEHPPKPAPRK